MNPIERLARSFETHISLPWQRHLSPSERVLFIVYPKEKERQLRFKKGLFQQATAKSHRGWNEICLDNVFPNWMCALDYCDEYFKFPEDLEQNLEGAFTDFVSEKVNNKMKEISENDVLALFGVGTLFGLTRVSEILKRLERGIHGRLVVFFPGSYEDRVYRLFDARDGWNYLAFPITLKDE